MTKDEKDFRFLNQLAEEQVADLVAMTDEEILLEASESGDAHATASSLRFAATNLVMEFRRSKLEAARQGVKAAKLQQQRQTSSGLTLKSKRAAIADVLAKRKDVPHDRLTAAARESKGEKLSDNDIESLYVDFVALGLIGDDDESGS